MSLNKNQVEIKMREVKRDEFAIAYGCLTLVDNDFADEMKGWALVRLMGRNCSTQSIVTRCTYYQKFTPKKPCKRLPRAMVG